METKVDTGNIENKDDEEFYKMMSKIGTCILGGIFFLIGPITMSLILEAFGKNIITHYIISLIIHCGFLLLISIILIEYFKSIDLNIVHPLRSYRIYPLSLYEAEKHYRDMAPSTYEFYKKLTLSAGGIFSFFFWFLYFTNNLAPAYVPIKISSLFLNFFLLCVTIVTTDFWYFSLHVLYHNPYLYKHFHKVHHQYHNITCLSSFHSSLVEYIFFDIPIYTFGWLSLLYFGYQISTSIITLSTGLILMDQIYVHSGYDLPFAPDKTISYLSESRFHFHHHKLNRGSYGALFGIFDRIFGTYNIFREKRE